jgi:putative selenium metabolism hydrolase
MDIMKEIRKKSEAYRDYTVENLSQLVKTRSYSGQEKDAAELTLKLCRDAGIKDVRIDGLGNVIARVGSGPRILAIDGHIDTVEVGDPAQWTRDPFSGVVEGEYLHGRGASDQKGGAASMITAARILQEMNYDGPFSVYFTFTVMEEDCDGMCWRYLIEEEKLVPEFAVSTEPTSLGLYRGQRGRMEMELSFTGVSAHGSAPERGVNAGYKAARAATAIGELNDRLPPDDDQFLGKGTVVVSQIHAHGPSQCAVPDQARLYLDRRLTWGETMESAVAQIRELCGEDLKDVVVPEYNKPSWKGTVFTQELYFPTWKTPEDHELVQAGVRAYQGLFDEPARVDKWTFSTNGVAIAGYHGVPCIGLGPGDEDQAHAPNECIRISDLAPAAAFYAALPHALAQ